MRKVRCEKGKVKDTRYKAQVVSLGNVVKYAPNSYWFAFNPDEIKTTKISLGRRICTDYLIIC
jgi:hypothetical protein